MSGRNSFEWEIVQAAPGHIPYLAENMREADRREVWASSRRSPHEALALSLAGSDTAWTCLVEGVPAFMFGVGRKGSVLSETGVPWLLGTPAIERVGMEFARRCRGYVGLMLKEFSRLENVIHAENAVSMRWLKWCGFHIDREHPATLNGETFYTFWEVRHV